jgi:hypothetical protein
MIDRRLKPRADFSSPQIREQLVLCFNNALGPPNKADLAIQEAFLKGTMTPGEAQLFISMCEYVLEIVERHTRRDHLNCPPK